MKALVYRRYGGSDVLELADVPQPQPREDEVLVRVTQFRVGEDVFGASNFGAFAELVCVSEETLVPKSAFAGRPRWSAAG